MQSNIKHTILTCVPQLKESGHLALIEGDSSYNIVEFTDLNQIAELMESNEVDLVIVEDGLPNVQLQDVVVRSREVDVDMQIIAVMKSTPQESASKLWMMGMDAFIFGNGSPSELAHRVARSLRMRWLSKQCLSLEKQNKELWQLAVTDALTGLMNRGHFNERVQKEFMRVDRYQGKLGCILIDVDFFKKINDDYGHLVGDHVLRSLGSVLKNTLRSVDIIARYGGEEFVALTPETIGGGLEIAAEKLRHAVEEYNFGTDLAEDTPGPDQVTISLGISSYPDERVDSSLKLLDLADQGLYKAKKNGRNRVEIA